MAAKRKWIVLAKLLLDSGTEYESDALVHHPDRTYEARVVQWGTIDRSIPSPAGLPQISDAMIRIADTDRKFRDLLSHQTPRRRTMELKLLQEGDSESGTDPIYVGEVVDAEFIPGAIDITLRDRTFAWIDEEIPAAITKENFPDITDDAEGGFLPIISGQVRSPADGPQGVITLPHIGFDIITGDRYGLSITPIWDVVLYRLETINEEGDQAWTVIDPAEYNINEEPMTLYGLSANPTFADFLEEQPKGTEIRADIDGIYFRGGWGTLVENGYNTSTSPPTGTPGALRNPIDFFINMTFFVMKKAGGASVDTASVFNQPAIATLWTKFEALGISNSVFCDGAITKAMTAREWLGQFLASFNLDMYLDRHGLITLNFTDATDAGRPVFTEGRLVLLNTFKERLPQPAINQVQFRYQLNYATDAWGTWGLANNLDDQATLGSAGTSSPEVRDLRIEKEVLDLFFIRVTAGGEYIVSKRLAFLSLGSFRQEWQMPAPEVLDDVELAKLIGLTHSQGLETGGYINREVKIIGLTLDVDRLIYTVRGILRVPQTITIPEAETPAITGAQIRVYVNGSEIPEMAYFAALADPNYIAAGKFGLYNDQMAANMPDPSGDVAGTQVWDSFEGGTPAGVVFTDNFNRANANTLGAGWTEDIIDGGSGVPTVFRIASNGLKVWTDEVIDFQLDWPVAVTVDMTDQYARMTLRDIGTGQGSAAVFVRGTGTAVADTFIGYCLTVANFGVDSALRLSIFYAPGGVINFVDQAVHAMSFSAGDVITLEVLDV